MFQEVGTEESCAVPGGRVFAHAPRLEEEPGAEVVCGVMRFPAKEVDQRRIAFGRQARIRRQIESASSPGIKATKRHDHRRGAGGHLLDGAAGHDVQWRDSECCGDGFGRAGPADRHIRCEKPEDFLPAGGRFEGHGNLANGKIQVQRRRRAR